MIFYFLKQHQVEQFRLNKAVLLWMLCLIGMQSVGQEVLSDVKLEKLSNQQYRVRYKFNSAKNYELYAVTIKVYRRRNGQVEEILSQAVDATSMNLEKMQSHIYNWQPEVGLIKEGDELQAKLVVSYNNPALAKKPGKPLNNQPPVANAGAFMDVHLPVSAPLTLNGSKSFDGDGKIVRIDWKQISGPTILQIKQADSSIASVNGDFKEGRYAFELTVTDEWNESSIDRVMITVKPGAAPITNVVKTDIPKQDTVRVVQQQVKPVSNAAIKPDTITIATPDKPAAIVTAKPNTQTQKNTSPAPVKTTPATARTNMPALKGGPSNAFINILLPGLGHYRVSGDQYGNDRKAGSFIVTGLYLGSLGGAGYYYYKADRDYKKYVDLSKFREQQTDAGGDVIGVRGANQAVAKQYLKDANTSRRNALILAGVGGGILAADLVYTFIKGSKNKRQWNRDAGLKAKLFLASDGSNMSAGVRVKL